jgi:hypothetical protein
LPRYTNNDSTRFSLTTQAKLAREGRKISLAYRIMLTTGLRLNELRTLLWSDLALDKSTLTVRAVNAKSRKSDVLPIPDDTLQAIKNWRRENPTSQGAVVTVTESLVQILNDDLTAAGISKSDEQGQTIDVHALRHTFGTRLCRAGVDIKTIQKLMRHEEASITLGLYLHSDHTRSRQAISTLPPLSLSQDIGHQAQPALRTGTDDKAVEIDHQPTSNQQGNKGDNITPSDVSGLGAGVAAPQAGASASSATGATRCPFPLSGRRFCRFLPNYFHLTLLTPPFF